MVRQTIASLNAVPEPKKHLKDEAPTLTTQLLNILMLWQCVVWKLPRPTNHSKDCGLTPFTHAGSITAFAGVNCASGQFAARRYSLSVRKNTGTYLLSCHVDSIRPALGMFYVLEAVCEVI